MRIVIRSRSARSLAWMMITSFVATSLFSSALLAAKVEMPESVKSIMVFPVDDSSGKVSSKVVADLGSLISDGIANYRVVEYSERIPCIQRIARVETEKPGSNAAGPFFTSSGASDTALTIARTVSADFLLVGSIDGYKVSDDGSSELVVSIDVVDAKTGGAVKSISVTGRSESSVSVAGKISPLVQDAAQKVIADINGGSALPAGETTVAPDAKRKSSKRSWISTLLLSVGIGILIGNADDGSSSSAD